MPQPDFIHLGKFLFLIPVFLIVLTIGLVGYFTERGYYQKPVPSPTPNVLPTATIATPPAGGSQIPKTPTQIKTYIDISGNFEFSYPDSVFMLPCGKEIYFYPNEVRNDGKIDCDGALNPPLVILKGTKQFRHDDNLVKSGQVTETKLSMGGVISIEQAVSQITKTDVDFKKRFFVENPPVVVAVTLNDINLETVYEKIRDSFTAL